MGNVPDRRAPLKPGRGCAQEPGVGWGMRYRGLCFILLPDRNMVDT